MKLPTLDAIESAAILVHSAMPATPQINWPLVSLRAGTQVWIKHENHTAIGAFKLRGGLVYFDELRRAQPDVLGVISATRGNHGQSIGFAARRSGLRAVVVVPRGNSREKNAAMRAGGVELIEHGGDFQDAYEHALGLEDELKLHFVPTFHEHLVRGVATYALELFTAVQDIDVLYVAIGQGSGICGALAARNALGLKTEIVGVVARAAPAYADSFERGTAVSRVVQSTVADGLACRTPNSDALRLIVEGVSRIVTVEESEIRAAMRALFTDTHNAAEGAGASALAAALKERAKLQEKRVAVILSGGNVDREVFAGILAEGES